MKKSTCFQIFIFFFLVTQNSFAQVDVMLMVQLMQPIGTNKRNYPLVEDGLTVKCSIIPTNLPTPL
jgi:hypothetical protein